MHGTPSQKNKFFLGTTVGRKLLNISLPMFTILDVVENIIFLDIKFST